MLLVGSRLAGKHILGREPLDHDYICTYDEYLHFVKTSVGIAAHYPISGNKQVVKFADGRIYEFEIAWEGSTGELLIQILSEIRKDQAAVTALDLLYTLKMSHRYKKDSPHFHKTRGDILTLREAGAKIPDALADWFLLREAATYTYSHPSLNKSKSDFFNGDGVTYHYDHDELHEVVKLLPQPAYAYFKPDENDVYCSKDLFDTLPEHMKLLAVFEESCVLAYERSLIPFQTWDNEFSIFLKALTKVASSITSGWFREYAWENLDSVVEMFHTRPVGWMKDLHDREITKLKRLT
jgi:hypothetical protein